MYKTCKYCGIVPVGHKCKNKPKRTQVKDKESDKFRSTAAWKRKAEQIKRRDLYLCRVCEAGLYNTVNRYNYKNLEAHHITSIAEDYNKRLDDDNIITLCQYHHKRAERGEIPKSILYDLIDSPPGVKNNRRGHLHTPPNPYIHTVGVFTMVFWKKKEGILNKWLIL